MKMSVLLVGDYPSDPTLGSSKVFYKLQEEFRALGHVCDMVLADEIGGPASRQIRQAVTPMLAARAIARRLQRTRYDVVDAASAEGLWFARGRVAGAGSPAFVCRSNGLEHLNYRRMLDDAREGLTSKPWTRRIWYPLSRLSQVERAARAADRLLLLNALDRQFAIDRGWLPASRIDVVPHGVSSRFLEGPGGGVGSRGDGLLFCGSWDNMKGISYLTAAFELLHQRGRHVRLTVLGPGVPPPDVLDGFSPAVAAFCQSRRACARRGSRPHVPLTRHPALDVDLRRVRPRAARGHEPADGGRDDAGRMCPRPGPRR